MSLKLWTTDINKLYLWSTEINKAYLGANLVYDKTVVANGLLNNLISYYKADTSWSFLDAHGSNNGTINGATFTASGKINWGYSFTTNDYIDLWWDNNLQPTSWKTITVNLWFKNSSSYSPYWFLWNWGYQNGVSWNASWFIALNSTNIIRLTWNGTDVLDASFTHNDWQWHMLTVVIQSTNAKIYVNANLLATWNITLNTSESTRNVQLWWLWVDNLFFLNWEIDEIASYLWEKTQTDIDNLYNSWAWLSYDNFTL